MSAVRYVLTIDGTPEGMILLDPARPVELPAGWTVVREDQWTGGTTDPPPPPNLAAATAAVDSLAGSVSGWAGLTAAQKDAATRLGLRLVVHLARAAIDQLDPS